MKNSSVLNKLSPKLIVFQSWNTVALVLLYLLLFFIGVFKYGLIDHLMSSFAEIFSQKPAVSSLIGTHVAFLLGILLVWLSIKDFTRQ